MPQIDEVGAYIRGLWLLILGDRSGYDWLDISASGVWRSFAAFLWCLPAMAVSWGAWRLFYLANMPVGTETGLVFILKLLFVDLAAWIFPLLLLAALARPLGYGNLLAVIIVATNWLCVPVFYAMAVPAAIRLVIPGSDGLTSLLSLILLITAFAAIFRLVKTIADDQTLLACALTALLVLPSLILGESLQRALGLMPL